MSVEVRNYKKEDLDGVNKVLREVFSREKVDFDLDNFYEVVLVVDGVIAGYLLLTKVWNPIREIYYFLIDYVCILSEYRGNGFGKEMLQYAEDIAKKEGVSFLQLTCSRFRIAAHQLYESQGYQKRDSDIYRKELV